MCGDSVVFLLPIWSALTGRRGETVRSVIKISGKLPQIQFLKEGSKSGGARVLLCCAHSILYAHVLCKCGRVVFFDIVLTIWDTFGKLLGAAGGLGKVVGTPWGG